MAIDPTSHSSQSCVHEIDIFELWGVLWAKKLLIIGVTTFCGFLGGLYGTFHPGKPDQYTYTALVEIGRYIMQSGSVQTLESPYDLQLILNQQPGGAKANVPRGSSSVLSLESIDVDPAVAKQRLDDTLTFIFDRHLDIAGKLSTPLLTNSRLVAKPVMSVYSIRNKWMLVLVASSIGGLFLGIVLVLLKNSVLRSGVAKTPYN